jgi:chromosome condensin MukBEF complex kleisin-like MukF subunit
MNETRNIRGEQQDVGQTVRIILADKKALQLTSRDIALLVLLRHHLASRVEPSPFLSEADLRSAIVRVADIEGADRQNAEKAATDQISRVLQSGCLARADMRTLAREVAAEYQLTTLGEAVADWESAQSAFSGAPLESILQMFNSNLLSIAEAAEAATTAQAWDQVRNMVIYGLKEMLVRAQHHQLDLDRQHGELREFIPELLRDQTETAIARCGEQVDRVHATIKDLHRVTLTTINAAHSYLSRIESAGAARGIDGVEALCAELSRHLDSIERWSHQRHGDWVAHCVNVHQHLRNLIAVHRQRRITEALTRSLADVPTWTLRVPDEGILWTPRLDWEVSKAVAIAPRRPKRREPRDIVDVVRDDLPELFHEWLKEEVASGEVRLTRLLQRATAAGKPMATIMFHLPWLMNAMTRTGKVDRRQRDWTTISAGLQAQELKVHPDALHR